jgi:hypothetical protein
MQKRNHFMYLLVAVMVTANACQNSDKDATPETSVNTTKPEVEVATTNDAEVLKKIALQENADFYKKDVDKWGAHFVHEPGVSWICVEDDITLRATGWEDLQKFVGDWMKENPTPESDSLLKNTTLVDVQQEIGDKLAFVRFKKFTPAPNGGTKVTLESRTFKKVNGEWKIISMTSAPGYSNAKSTNNIFVHEPAKKAKGA